MRGAEARRGVAVAARLLLHDLDELLDGLRRKRRMHHQHAGRRGDPDHRREIGQRLVRQLGIEMRQHRLGALEADQHGQAVRRRFRDIVRRQHAVGAGLVFHDDGRAAVFLDLLREHAGEDVGHAAGLGRHDDADRLVGKVLAARRRKRQQDRARSHGEPERRDAAHNAAHDLAHNLAHELPPLTTASSLPYRAMRCQPPWPPSLCACRLTQRKTRPLARPRSTTAKSSR